MQPKLAIVDPPFEAAVIHGGGIEPLNQFRNMVAVNTVLRVSNLLELARRAEVDSVLVEQFSEVADWMAALPAKRLRALCEEPFLQTWVNDTRRSLVGESEESTLPTLPASALLGRLPYLMLNYLPEVNPSRRRWSACAAAGGRCAPLDLSFRWDEETDLPVVVESSDSEVRVSACRGREAALLRKDGGLEVEHCTGFRITGRRFTLTGVEVVQKEDFPELMRLNDEDKSVVPSAVMHPDATLGAAFDFLLNAWPEAVADVVTVFRGLVALDAAEGHTYNSTADSAPYVLQLTVRPDEFRVGLAEAMVHETAHLKLFLLESAAPLLVDDEVPRYYHPWRPDLRPMRGVLLGAHAFLNITEMYRNAVEGKTSDRYGRQEYDFACKEYETRLREVREAMQTLASHANFTQVGASVYESMCRISGFQP